MSEKERDLAMPIFKRLLGYVKELKLMLFIAILANIIYSAMDAWFISLIKPLMDEGIVKGDISYVKIAPLFIVGLLFIRGLASIVSTYCMAWVGQTIVQKMRQQLFDKYMMLPSKFFDGSSTGQLVSKVTFNTQQVASASSDSLTKMVREGALLVFAIGMLFYINWRLALIYFVSAPVIAFLVSLTSKRFRKVSRNIQNAMGGVNQTTQEVINGHKVVKTYNGESFEKERFSDVVNKNRQQNLKLILTKAVSVPLIQMIAALAMSIVVFYSAFEIEKGNLTVGEFTMLFLYMFAMFKPLKVLSNLNSVMQQGLAAAQDIFEIIDKDKEKDNGVKSLESSPELIKFEQVSFAYDTEDKRVLENISLDIKKGETVALVGHSGSGKSTVTNLLLRFYNPESGSVKFNDIDINDYTLESLRKNIAYVSQQVTLFNDSVSANIAYAQNSFEKDKLIEAAEKAHALEFIEKLQDGFDTQIGENGSRLSGGQRQRLAIARAIYKDAPIIILDEATSALDTQSERHIQSALDALTKNRTTLVIAHRLSTIENADKIIVMDSGKIIEQGKHKELIALNGAYAKLHSIQFSDR